MDLASAADSVVAQFAPDECELSFVIPCLNEEETVAQTVAAAKSFLAEHGVNGEIVVADNASSDRSAERALAAGARVVTIQTRGYGSAIMGGIAAARGRFIIVGDADASYDFTSVGPFLDKLRDGFDLVMGNRFKGKVLPGAMPALHRFLGNPVLTGIGRLFYRTDIGDFHCGLRGFTKTAIHQMDLQTTGMEFASEMVVKAALLGMKIGEVPTTLAPDGRSRPPHLRSWRDGWRHLRFLLLYSPRWLFLYPGLFLMLLGGIVGGWLIRGPRPVGAVQLDIHTLLYASLAIEIGFQAVLFALFSNVYAVEVNLLPRVAGLERWKRYVRMETGLLAGVIAVMAGLALSIAAVGQWQESGFGPLDPTTTFRLVIPASLFLCLGCETILASFFLGLLTARRRPQNS